MAQPLTGRCQCGGVVFTLAEPPFFTVACHCTECQQLGSGAFTFSFLTERQHFSVEGELARYDRAQDSGGVARCYFCPTCGNRIYHESDDPDDPILRVKGSLDDKSAIQPRARMWLRSRQPWMSRIGRGLDDLPGFETQSRDRAVVMRRVALGTFWAGVRLAVTVLGWVCIGLVGWHLIS